MSRTAISQTPLPPAAAEAVSGAAAAVEYPGRSWIAQSVWHGVAVAQAKLALRNHFRDREDVLVAMELAVYYRRGDSETFLKPDVQVAFGVGRAGDRNSYQVWEEGKAPDFVLEVASPSTAGRDARPKAREYLRIGVREYWRLDPQGSLMRRPLEGYELSGGRYEPVSTVRGAGGRLYLRSRVLGLDLRSQRRDGARVLVFRDRRTGEEFDGALEEAERRQRAAEFRLGQEASRRRTAESRADAEAARRRVAESRADAEAAGRRAAESRADAEAARRRVADGHRRAAEERALALEEQLRNLTSRTPRTGRE